jgi:LysR family glycine cleavage system transcriptional activator
VTAAAVGQQIRTLERYLGVDLFRRTRRTAIPTARARKIQPRLTAHLAGLAALMSELVDTASDRRLAITLPSSFAENWLTHHISDFYQTHSSVDLRLDATNRMVDLRTEDFDFALRYSLPSDDMFEEIELFGDYVLPLCSPDFARRHGIGSSLRSLKDIPLVHLDDRTPDPDWADWAAWGDAFGFEPGQLRDGVHYTQVSSGLQVARAGQGLVLCGVTEAFMSLRAGHLVMPFGPEMRCRTGYKYRLIWQRDRELSELQDAFRQWLMTKAEAFSASVGELLCSDADSRSVSLSGP